MSAPNPQVGLEVTTRRTITATTESPDGMTLDELAGLLRRAMAAGMDPHTPLRVRTACPTTSPRSTRSAVAPAAAPRSR